MKKEKEKWKVAYQEGRTIEKRKKETKPLLEKKINEKRGRSNGAKNIEGKVDKKRSKTPKMNNIKQGRQKGKMKLKRATKT